MALHAELDGDSKTYARGRLRLEVPTNQNKRLILHFTAAVAFAYIAWYCATAVLRSPESPGVVWATAKGAIMFGSLGLVQSAALRVARRNVVVWSYALCTGIAGASVFGLVLYLGGGMEMADAAKHGRLGAVQWVWCGTAVGFWVGLVQLWPLRKAIRKPLLWPVTSLCAWGAGALFEVVFMVFATETGASPGIGSSIGVLASLIIGGITGAAAVLLTKPGDDDEQSRRVDETGEEHRG